MKKVLILPLLVILLLEANAQNIISGKVLDYITEEPIASVNITLIDSNQGTSSNTTGEFEIIIERIPCTLEFTHIGYENHIIKISKYDLDPLNIMLIPKVNKLTEISITSKKEDKVLSPGNSFSILSFEINKEKLFWLEYAGSFKNKIISCQDLLTEKTVSISLDTIKHIQYLEESCDENLYLITRDFAYPLVVENGQIKLGNRISSVTYENYIKPCVLRTESDLIYLRSSYNGLQKNYLRYNLKATSLTNFKTISEEQEIAQLKNDISLIKQSETATNITSNSSTRNKIIRDLQKKGDFLEMIYYKPEFENFLFTSNKKLILLNHVQGRIEIFKNYDLINFKNLTYIKDKNWLRNIVLDKKDEKIYTCFKSQNGINIHQINIDDGDTSFVDHLQIEISLFDKIRIHEDFIYYLKKSKDNFTKLILIKRPINL